jgi:hypothetical protein
MTDDPNKKQNESNQQGQQGQQRQPGQQQQYNPPDSTRRPSQGGQDADQDEQKKDQGGQRKAS